MTKNDFWTINFPGGDHVIWADDTQHINNVLSTIAAQDVPTEKRDDVAGYIDRALFWDTVEPAIDSAIKDKLEHLFNQLKELEVLS